MAAKNKLLLIPIPSKRGSHVSFSLSFLPLFSTSPSRPLLSLSCLFVLAFPFHTLPHSLLLPTTRIRFETPLRAAYDF